MSNQQAAAKFTQQELNFLGHIQNVTKKGTSVQSGNGVLTSFTIAHGVGAVPSFFGVFPGSAAAAQLHYMTVDATNITITFLAAPANSASNLTFIWTANA